LILSIIQDRTITPERAASQLAVLTTRVPGRYVGAARFLRKEVLVILGLLGGGFGFYNSRRGGS